MSRHDTFRDDLFESYPPRPRSCDNCKKTSTFPAGVVKKEKNCIMPSGVSIRPDISIWNGNDIVATLEVIDTNVSGAALEAERGIPNAFFFHVEGYFWCSPWCYQWAHGPRNHSYGMIDLGGGKRGFRCMSCGAGLSYSRVKPPCPGMPYPANATEPL